VGSGRRIALLGVMTLVATLVGTGVAAAPETRLAPAGPVVTDLPPAVPVVDGYYGKAVGIDGNRILVGAPLDDMVVGNTTYFAVGSVWLYDWTGSAWSGTEFRPPYWVDGSDNYGYWGESVGIDGNTFVVGAWLGDGQVGHSGIASVYRYTGGSWNSTQLDASDGAGLDWFGKSVAVSGDRVVVGAPEADAPPVGTGGVYVFDRSGANWVETKLVLTGSANEDRVGLGNQGVAVDGDVVVVGVPQGYPYGGSGAGTGRVHVFTKSGGVWGEQVLAPVGVATDHAFGWSVAINGNRIVVGAPGDDGKGDNAGAAYVFENSGGVWSQTKKLRASGGSAGDTYGWSVGVSGDRIAIGAPGKASGAVYWYTGSGANWKDVGPAPRYDSSPGFGRAVDVDDNRIVAGAPYYNTEGKEDAGTAKVLEFMYCSGRAATMVGTDGPDTLIGTSKKDVIVGLAGNDVITGGMGNDFICAGDGDDNVNGSRGNDRILGEGGKDVLNGSLGDDKLYGGNGADTLIGGNDDDVLYGGGGSDRLLDKSGNDRAYGEDGNDRFTAGDGDDTYHGGDGTDTIRFSAATSANVDLILGTATGLGSDVLKQLENVKGSPGADQITGSNRSNLLVGAGGDDTLSGKGGDDTLVGGSGSDHLLGGAGGDTLMGNSGNDTLDGGTGSDTCLTGEILISCE